MAQTTRTRQSGFVVCEANKIIGYYALAGNGERSCGSETFLAPPIPVVVLARLAVDRAHQGRGLGRVLVRDGARRVVHAADAIGIRGILVHANSAEAKAFYLSLGFDPSPIELMTLSRFRTYARALDESKGVRDRPCKTG